MPHSHDIAVVIVGEQSSLKEAGNAVRRIAGACMVILGPKGFSGVSEEEIRYWCRELKALHDGRILYMATHHRATADIASAEGWETVISIKYLKFLLNNSSSRSEALRIFSPMSWRRDIRTRLQFMGLLSLPKVRIWILLGTCVCIFLFVMLRLLPSAQVEIWANQNTMSRTMNILLVSSGATIDSSLERIDKLELYPVTIQIDKTITFDQVGTSFTGRNAEMMLTVFNDSADEYSLRKGTRFTNQAGMVFRLQSDLILAAHSKETVLTVADSVDLFGDIVGQRGNVPAGIKWEILKLADAERKLIYGRNEKPATGGKTSYQNVVKKENLQMAKKKLEQELFAAAKQMADEEAIERSDASHHAIVQLRYDDLTHVEYKNFDLSEPFIGQNVSSVPVHGSIVYTVLLYDRDALLNLLKKSVMSHVSAKKKIVEDSISQENMNIHIVPPWDDGLKWVKITADLTYTEKFILSPITPTGARFSKYIRDHVAGKSILDAERIIKNLPEVAKVKVHTWPPWVGSLPALGSSIDIQDR